MFEAHAVKNTFGEIEAFTFSMPVRTAVRIHYVAARRISEEEGAVQRVLNRRRVDAIKKFILDGNRFFNTFILNWTNTDNLPVFEDNKIKLNETEHGAQVIDGQHRLAGLSRAMDEQSEIGDQNILVTMCIRLSTKQAASIFVNINNEQKPVPKSLIYDLFGLIEDETDHVITRSNDIAQDLNDNVESPYNGWIRFPGKAIPKGELRLDSATVVNALKKHLGKDGVFANINLTSLDIQKQVIINFLQALKSFYDEKGLWDSKTKNPFLRSSGFNGAIDYLASKLLRECATERSFTIATFKDHLRLDPGELLLYSSIKSLDGKTARKRVADYLESTFRESLPQQDEYEF